MALDAVLLLSFGGPEGPEQVRPFLENVTRGRGVPAARLDAVAEHYLHFGGVSPINGINRALAEAMRAEMPDLPVYFGNRNWEPYAEDVVAQMAADGVRRAAVFPTSAWGGYSGCEQYAEDIARARRVAGERAPELVKLRQYFDHPLFVAMFAEAIAAAADTLPAGLRESARLVFTAHSIPVAADERYGPRLYSSQVGYATGLVAAAAGYPDYDQVWQSRSGPPQVPWLEPDVETHLAALADARVPAVIVCPIGFLSDNIEVIWDLDNEVRTQAQAAGIAYTRAATPNSDRRLARLARSLIEELRDGTAPERVAGPTALGCGFGVNGEPCGSSHCTAVVAPAG
ncbi:ferrochelatase [Mycolicibacter longobardus]|uniref:Coproporphyrin III ferrochelatase n=1 Tax=Mycolicibacter longobardus TaxID=1108812 RepID=A0A1X1YPK8_9MYCO|nr:ferrochelatase [Mycolicibacter longobardus]MCV7384508.1 ferrochelatase [Mycolicibacter longobardus]ORW12965.1 ferrochelatase [Mycolicibacter longobardus]